MNERTNLKINTEEEILALISALSRNKRLVEEHPQLLRRLQAKLEWWRQAKSNRVIRDEETSDGEK